MSSIATAGLNNVVNMIPARDAEEFRAFPESDVAYIRSWLNWTDRHVPYLKRAKILPILPLTGCVDGAYMTFNQSSFLFLFNPYATSRNAPILRLNQSLDFSETAQEWLVEQIDVDSKGFGTGLNRNLGTVVFGSVLPFASLRGNEAAIYRIAPMVTIFCFS